VISPERRREEEEEEEEEATPLQHLLVPAGPSRGLGGD